VCIGKLLVEVLNRLIESIDFLTVGGVGLGLTLVDVLLEVVGVEQQGVFLQLLD